MRTAGTAKQAMLTVQERMRAELHHKETIDQELQTLITVLKNLETHEQQYAAEKVRLDQIERRISDEKNQVTVLTFACEQNVQLIEQQKSSIRQELATWRSIHKKQHQLANKESLEEQKAAIALTIERHQQILQSYLELKETYLKLKEEEQRVTQQTTEKQATLINNQLLTLERARARVEQTTREQETLTKQRTAHQAQSSALIAEIKRLEATLSPTQAAALGAQEKQFEKRKEHYQKYIVMGNMLTTELKNLAQKDALVRNEQDPSCPLCEQNLSASRRRLLKQQFTLNQRFLAHQRNRLVQVVKQLKQILLTQHSQIAALKEIQAQHTATTITLEEYRKQHTALEAQSVQITQALEQCIAQFATHQAAYAQEQTNLEKLKATQLSWKNEPDYQRIVQEKTNVEEKLARTIYNQDAHKKAISTLQAIEQQLQEYQQIQHAMLAQEQRKATIHTYCAQLRTSKEKHQHLATDIASFNRLAQEENTLLTEKNNLALTIKNAQQEKEAILQKKGSLETLLKKLNEVEQELANQHAKITELDAQIFDYQTIATATSKDGIQALLIEDTIPELEQETNYLLSRLTNNQAHITIESLRDLKKGGTKETLDINISDAAGIRPYELFSGGEAFRIDFALRIAIAKLLARRAGTALQTLIIDEGFGSQDEEGLGYIMDAIYKIQDDFAKVIIVSHLPTMKDQFPVHFVIEKGPNGSTVEIMEQG
jgi:exonuclease SbcC